MRFLSALILAAALNAGDTAAIARPVDADRPLIQIAILVDDSGSMSGLINQARSHLWDLVNQLASTTRDGQRPRLQVALYHYGDKPFLVQPLIPLSDDLDAVSQQLFAINGGSGDEHCGEVIHNAVNQLAWSPRRDDLKLIIIAGNEPFTQGPVDWRGACQAAIAKGIQVNTVHCGSRDEGINGQWEAGAKAADGSFACIDQNAVRPAIAAPQDEELRKLNEGLNGTYLTYGSQAAQEAAANQMAQDRNAAAAAPAAFASRAQTKASSAYRNSGWDLVDAVKEQKVELAKLDQDELPEQLKGVAPAERAQVVAEMERKRTGIQAQIVRLAKERDAYVSAEEAKLAAAGGAPTLRDALRQSLATQAAQRGFTASK